MKQTVGPGNAGQLYFRDGEVFVLESYCAAPTVVMRNIQTGEKIGGAVGCLLLAGMELLVKESNGVSARLGNLAAGE